MHLEEIQSPRDLKELSMGEMNDLAMEIRRKLIETISERGGHLASNLGAVELTLALHRVFDMPDDKIIFDVGHQSYVHKLVTGRYRQFDTLRSYGGLSGFPKRCESEYDVFETGHSSTAISAALGMARARDYQGKKHHVVAVVGDGAMTGGMCYEALDDAGSSRTRLIVILNDNEMSIAPNVGALSQYLTDIRVSKGWTSTKKHVKSHLPKVPLIGKPLYRVMNWMKETIKSMFVDVGFFEALGFEYFGPIDGHDLPTLEHTLQRVKEIDRPCLVHVLTRKGYGYDKAEEKPERFHGVAPFYAETGEARKEPKVEGFGEAMAKALAELADKDERIVAITAAMMSGTGLTHFQQKHPTRVMDVGITEEHAATMAAGLAAGGMKPYFAVYASFFQRSYDQMIHDVCMQKLPVTFMLDRAGLVGEDGQTHHGVYDLASMLPIPNMTVLAPRDLAELRAVVRWTQGFDAPCAIRYGRGGVDMSARYPYPDTFSFGKWEVLEQGDDCAVLAVGSMVSLAAEAVEMLRERGIRAQLVNCSTVKPLDEAMLRSLAGKPIITVEEHVLIGGFGSYVAAWCAAHHQAEPLLMLGIPDQFITHGSRKKLLDTLGLMPDQLCERIAQALKERKQ